MKILSPYRDGEEEFSVTGKEVTVPDSVWVWNVSNKCYRTILSGTFKVDYLIYETMAFEELSDNDTHHVGITIVEDFGNQYDEYAMRVFWIPVLGSGVVPSSPCRYQSWVDQVVSLRLQRHFLGYIPGSAGRSLNTMLAKRWRGQHSTSVRLLGIMESHPMPTTISRERMAPNILIEIVVDSQETEDTPKYNILL